MDLFSDRQFREMIDHQNEVENVLQAAVTFPVAFDSTDPRVQDLDGDSARLLETAIPHVPHSRSEPRIQLSDGGPDQPNSHHAREESLENALYDTTEELVTRNGLENLDLHLIHHQLMERVVIMNRLLSFLVNVRSGQNTLSSPEADT